VRVKAFTRRHGPASLSESVHDDVRRGDKMPYSQKEYTIRFYRDEWWAQRFDRAGINKPAGWVTSSHRYQKIHEAQEVVRHINALKPERPVELVHL
jgi:hypothetical protein